MASVEHVEARTEGHERPTVTVVVPCYNAEATIAATLTSVQAQTLPDLEVLVIDDGSRDRSREIVRWLGENDGRIRLIEQENSGPSVARNRGVDLASGAYIAFLDADDLWLPQHLELNVAALAADPSLGVSFSPCRYIDEAARPTGDCSRTWAGDVQYRDVLAGNPTSTCSAIVARREVFGEAGPMRQDMSYAEDQEWLFRVIASGWKLRGTSAYTVLYRIRSGSLSSDTRRMLAGWAAFLEHARNASPEVVQANLPYATWHMRLYHAKRAIQTGQPASVARGHLMEGLSAAPGMAIRSPLRTLFIAGACIAPSLARGAIHIAKGVRHG